MASQAAALNFSRGGGGGGGYKMEKSQVRMAKTFSIPLFIA